MVDLKSFTESDMVGSNQQINIDGMECYATESVEINDSGKALLVKTKHNNIIADHYEHSQIILTTRLFIPSDSDEFKNIKELYSLKKPIRVVTSTGAFKDMVITAFNPEINTSQGLITAAITFTQLVFKKSKRSPSEFPDPPSTFGTGSISVKSTPTGAAVTLDSKDTGKSTPCTLDTIDSGDHTLELTKSKYTTYKTTATVSNKKTTEVTATLEELPPPAPSSISITCTPVANYDINSGKITGTTPLTDRGYYTKSGDKVENILTGDVLAIKLTADGYTDVTASKTVSSTKESYTFTMTKDPNVASFPAFTDTELASFAFEATNQTDYPDSKERRYSFSSFVFNRQTGELGFVGKVPNMANATGYTDFKCYVKLPDHYKCTAKSTQISSVTSRAENHLFSPPALSILYETFIPNPVTAAGSGSCNYITNARDTTSTDYKSLTFSQMEKIVANNTKSLTFFALTNSSGSTTVTDSDIYYDRKTGVITFFGVTEKQVRDTDEVDVVGRQAIAPLLHLDNYGAVFLFKFCVNGIWDVQTDPWYTEFRYNTEVANQVVDALKAKLPGGSIIVRTRGCGTYMRWEEFYDGSLSEYGIHELIGHGFRYYELKDLSKTYLGPDEHKGLYDNQPQVNDFGGIRIQYIKPGGSNYVPRVFRLVLSDTNYKTGTPDSAEMS